MTKRTRPGDTPVTHTKLEAVAKLMTVKDLSEMLSIPVNTLYGWRHRHQGPRGYRIGRHLRYSRTDVDTWLEGQTDEARLVR